MPTMRLKLKTAEGPKTPEVKGRHIPQAFWQLFRPLPLNGIL